MANVRPEVTLTPRRRPGAPGPRAPSVFERGPLRSDDAAVSLVWFPTAAGDRLAWRARVEPEGFPQVYDILVDAQDGTVLYRRNLVRYADGAGTVPQSDETQQLGSRGGPTSIPRDPTRPVPSILRTAARPPAAT